MPLFFDINAKKIQCIQWVTPFVFSQISSANLMGFISVFTDDWFVKDTVPQSVMAVPFDTSIGLFNVLVYHILCRKMCTSNAVALYIKITHKSRIRKKNTYVTKSILYKHNDVKWLHVVFLQNKSIIFWTVVEALFFKQFWWESPYSLKTVSSENLFVMIYFIWKKVKYVFNI